MIKCPKGADGCFLGIIGLFNSDLWWRLSLNVCGWFVDGLRTQLTPYPLSFVYRPGESSKKTEESVTETCSRISPLSSPTLGS